MAAVTYPEVLKTDTLVVLASGDNEGTVINIPRSGTQFMVGDVILFTKEPHIEVEINGITHRLIKDTNVYGWYYKVPRDAPTGPPV